MHRLTSTLLHQRIVYRIFVPTMFLFIFIETGNSSLSEPNDVFANRTVDIVNNQTISAATAATVLQRSNGITLRVVDKPSAVPPSPPRGCAISYHMTAVNLTQQLTFQNVTSASSTSHCARKCYLFGCTVAQFLPGVAEANTGTCRVFFGPEPTMCERSLPPTPTFGPSDPIQLQCFRCVTGRKPTPSLAITTTASPVPKEVTTGNKILETEIVANDIINFKALQASTDVFQNGITVKQLGSETLPRNSVVDQKSGLVPPPITTISGSIPGLFVTTVKPNTSIVAGDPTTRNAVLASVLSAPSVQSAPGPNAAIIDKYFSPPGVFPQPPGFFIDAKPTTLEHKAEVTSAINATAIDASLSNESHSIESVNISNDLFPNLATFIKNDSNDFTSSTRTLTNLSNNISTSRFGQDVNLTSFVDFATDSLGNVTAFFNEFKNRSHSWSTKPFDIISNFSSILAEGAAQIETIRIFNETSAIFNSTLSNTNAPTEQFGHNTTTEQLEIPGFNLTSENNSFHLPNNSSKNESLTSEISLGEMFLRLLNLINRTIETENASNVSNWVIKLAPSQSQNISMENNNSIVDHSVNDSTFITHSSNIALNDSSPSNDSKVIFNFKTVMDDASAAAKPNENIKTETKSEVKSSFQTKPEIPEGFGGGCSVYFRLSNWSTDPNMKFSTSMVATSVSNCARKCYLFGCKTAQYSPGGTIGSSGSCRFSFSQSAQSCEEHHNRTNHYNGPDAVQIQCLRCSYKTLL